MTKFLLCFKSFSYYLFTKTVAGQPDKVWSLLRPVFVYVSVGVVEVRGDYEVIGIEVIVCGTRF